MKKIIASILLCLSFFGASAQNDEVFEIVEYNPQYIGGDEAMRSFIDEKMVYPASAIEDEKEGTVIVEFIVEKDSSLSNIKTIKSFDDDCAAEAVRIVKMMKWAAGKQRGKPVRVKWRIPVKFRLADRAGRELPPPMPPPIPEPNKQEKDSIGEKMPEYIGGELARQKFIAKNLVYPPNIEGLKSGTIKVEFIVETDGTVSNVKILKSFNADFSAEFVRVIKLMKWIPGEQRGKKVRVKMRMPFKIRTQE